MIAACPKCGFVHQTVGFRNCVINLREDNGQWYHRVLLPDGVEIDSFEVDQTPFASMELAIIDARELIVACLEERE